MVDLVMPQMGESLTEGTVTSWLRSEGDEIKRDEPLLEIDTDKVSTVVEAPVEGVLAEVLVAEGQTVGVGTVLARIDPAEGAAPREPEEEAKGHFGGAGDVETLTFRSADQADRAAEPARSEKPAASTPGGPRLVGEVGSPGRDFLSPGVVSLAAREGIPLEELRTIDGSGRGGRITRRDVESWLEQRGQVRDRPAGPAAAAAPAPGAAPAEAVPERYVYTPTQRDERVPMSSVRKRIADHMVWSKRISPHTVATDEMDASALVTYVTDHKESFERDAGVPLTYTTVIGYATVQLLSEFPRMNAAVVGEELVLRPYVHLGIAVALEDADELVVPVIADADQLPLDVFARRLDDVVTRARERQLELRELEGGTFTYTNIGAIGGTSGAAIINQPQVAILSTYAIRERPWVVDGEVVARPVMGLSVSSDHRVVDGVMVYRFLARLIERLSDPGDLTGAP
jgi:pyruvate/2-oxoglutarate dehydrogenase complex dihydrolipoamide acyltransferase (E2) component